ncbi:MAG: hypothetical protein LBP42_03130, partial [Treponema sp.]|nr:hypothetical protein [Treponema sp.]
MVKNYFRPARSFVGAAAAFLLSAFSLFAQTAPDTPAAPRSQDAGWNYRTGRDLEARGRAGEAAPFYAEAVRISRDEIARNIATA